MGNVTLDFNGHYISNLAAGKGTYAYGLYGNNRANITVQNGTIVGFLYGILFDGTSGSSANNTGNVIQNMRLPSNTYTGIYLGSPTTCRIEGCQINKTGGTTANGANSTTYGIYVTEGSVTLRNNQISTVTPVGSGTTGYGIHCHNSNNHFVVGNQMDTCGVGLRMTADLGKYQNNLTNSCTTAFSGGVDAGGNN